MSVESELNLRAFQDALESNDIASVTRQVIEHSFLLIHLAEEADEEDTLGALTAQYRDSDYLVAFSNQNFASQFVEQRSDLFDSEAEVSGFWVDGQTMLDYLDNELGVLMNPDSDHQCRMDAELIGTILDELNLR